MTARAWGLAAACLLAGVCSSTASASAAASAPAKAAAPAPTPAWDGRVDRVVLDRRINENSGMAASRRFPGVLWAIEDSNNPPVVAGIDEQGRTAARLTLVGATNVDWEAVAPLTLPGGRPALAVADIGDNSAVRRQVVVYVIAEPARLASARVQVLATLRLTYPQGADDAETLLADPRDGRLYIVTKDLLGAVLYAVPTSVWPPRTAPNGLARRAMLQVRAGLSDPLVTDGAVLPDGRVVLRDYLDASLFPAADTMSAPHVASLARRRLPGEPQGEALALVAGGTAALIGGEGVRQPVRRVWLGGLTAAAAAIRPSPVATSSPTASPTATPIVTASSRAGDRPRHAVSRWVSAMIPGVLGVLSALIAFSVLTVRDRRRRRSRAPARSSRR